MKVQNIKVKCIKRYHKKIADKVKKPTFATGAIVWTSCLNIVQSGYSNSFMACRMRSSTLRKNPSDGRPFVRLQGKEGERKERNLIKQLFFFTSGVLILLLSRTIQTWVSVLYHNRAYFNKNNTNVNTVFFPCKDPTPQNQKHTKNKLG